MSVSLDALNDDTLICIFTVLAIPEILSLRQTSRRLYLLSEEHAVWETACTNDVLGNGIPFLKRPLTSFAAKDLERQTLRAYRLGLNWRSPNTRFRRVTSCPVKSGFVEEIKFFSRRGRTLIVTKCTSIWPTLDIRDSESLQVVAQWNPGKFFFNGMAVNSDDQSDAAIAVSVIKNAHATVEMLAISDADADNITVRPWRTLDTPNKPVALNGDVVALCDSDSETLILNWRTQEQALLKSINRYTWQDRPLRVAFANGSVFVLRAHSICIFEEPKMVLPGDDLDVVFPRVHKSFGWVDGASLTLAPSASYCPAGPAHALLSLLVRYKSIDPWRHSGQFKFMTLNADFDRDPPHAFNDTPLAEDESDPSPFNSIATLSSQPCGSPRCSDMVLGSYGTAVWVQPSDWAALGLVSDDDLVKSMPSPSLDTLVVALFPGLLNRGSPEAHVKITLENSEGTWLCLDYDEAQGLIALGLSSGEVVVYRL